MAADQHPLVQEACDMGCEPDHAIAALMSYAETTSGGCVSKLTVQANGNAFMNFLFSFQHRPQQQQRPQQPVAPASERPQQQPRHSRQQPQRGCKRSSPDPDSIDSATVEEEEEISTAGDSDFVVENNSRQSLEGTWQEASALMHSSKQQPQQQQQQQMRKRLRRSCDAAAHAAPHAAAAAGAGSGDDSEPVVRVAQHRRRVLQDSSSGGEDCGDAGAGPARAGTARRGGAAGAGVRGRYQQAAAQQGCDATPTGEDLDFLITKATPAPATAARAGSRGMPSLLQQQQLLRAPAKQAASQQKQQKKAAATAGLDGQPKINQFFSTPAQQPGRGAGAAGPAGVGGGSVGKTGPSPLNVTRVTSSKRSSSNSFAERLRPEMGTGLAGGAGAFRTPAQLVRGPSSSTPLAGTYMGQGAAAAARIVGMAGRQQQGFAAGAHSGPVAPWSQQLTAQEALMDQLDLVNLKVFGHSSFRPQQKQIVQQAVQGKDLFVLMPTGGGKSLCYQLPAVLMPGVTVVVCPLLSLMQDQVRALCQNPNGGIPATFLSSQQSDTEAIAVKKELSKARPTVKLLYVTPEQLVKSNALRSILQRLSQSGLLARFVIDEAHCVSTWGHDFRPDYKGLRILRTQFKQTPITAVTATATREVQADIISTLGITRTVKIHQTSFLRPNLLLKVVPKVKEADEETGMPLFMVRLISYIKDRPQHIAAAAAAVARQAKDAATQAAQAAAACGLAAGQQQEQLRAQAAAAAATAAAAEAEAAAGADAAAGKVGSSGLSCSGIVYCLSRKEAEGVAAALDQEGGIKAKHYHAGMTPKQRTEVQNDFFSGKVQVIVATIAFGMGIDKPDVRFVVHFCLSKSLEGYYQEAGRAGRDGKPAECVLMFSHSDINRHMFIMRKSMGGNKGTDRFAKAVDQLETMKGYAMNPEKVCRHAILLEYFGVLEADLPDRKCGCSCDVCRGDVVPLNPEEWEAAAAAQEDAAQHELIDLAEIEEEDDDDLEQQQQQQQRSGGRRRRPLYNAAGGDVDGGGEDPQAGGSEGGMESDSMEVLGSEGSESDGSESDGEGSSGGSSEDFGDGSEDEGSPRYTAAAGGGSGGGGGSRPAPQDQQQPQQRRRDGMGQQQQQPSRLQSQQRQQQQQQAAGPCGFQRASLMQQQPSDVPGAQPKQQQQKQQVRQQQQQQQQQRARQQQQQPQQQPPDAAGSKQPPPELQKQHQEQQQQPVQPAAHIQRMRQQQHHQQQQQQQAAGHLPAAAQQAQQQQPAGGGGFQRASQLQQQQQPGLHPTAGLGQQQQQQHRSQAGLGLGSSRFNRGPAAGLSRPAAAGGDTIASKAAAAVAAATAAAVEREGASAGVDTGGAAALAPGVRASGWVVKKRLGMGGGSGGGRTSGNGSAGGSSRPSPAEALAKDLQDADNFGMY